MVPTSDNYHFYVLLQIRIRLGSSDMLGGGVRGRGGQECRRGGEERRGVVGWRGGRRRWDREGGEEGE
jgi:hypothetical protein